LRFRATLQWRSLGPFSKVITVLELPFTLARSLTVPLAMTKEWGNLGCKCTTNPHYDTTHDCSGITC
jgi:hypothetical protein